MAQVLFAAEKSPEGKALSVEISRCLQLQAPEKT